MGNPITTASLYAGEAGAYLGAAAKSGKTLADGQITILEGIKYKKTLTIVSSASIISNADCDFSDGTLTLTDRALEPTDKKMNLSLCATDLEQDWQAAQMKAGANNSNMGADFAAFMMDYLGAQIGENIETQIWADTVTNLTADGTVVDVTSVALDQNVIIAQMQAVYNAVPTAVWGKDDLRIYLGTDAIRYYIAAMSELGYMTAYYAGDVPLLFEGVEVVHAPGLVKNKMVAARVSNLYWGTDLQSDATSFKVLDQRDISGANEIRIAANFSSGVQHGVGADIVLYS